MSNTCTITTANTAESRCKLELGAIRRNVLTPVSAIFTGLDSLGAAQTLDEWILEGIHAASAEDRFYPMPLTTGIEDKSTDPKMWEDGLGRQHQLMEGVFGIQQKFERDHCLTKRIVEFNNQEFRVLKFDGAGNVEVIENGDGDYIGEKVKVFVSHPKASTFSELGEPMASFIAVDPNEHNSRVVTKTDLNFSQDLLGLEDVTMHVSLVSSNYIITFTENCSGKDVTADLAAASAVDACWKIDKAGVIADVVASPTYVAASKHFTAVAATVYAEGTKLKLADPSVLYANGISGKEQADWVTLTNPGS